MMYVGLKVPAGSIFKKIQFAAWWNMLVNEDKWCVTRLESPMGISTHPFLKRFFFWGGVDHFQSLSWMCCNIASVYGLVSGLWAMWDLSPLTGERTCSPGLGWWSLPHWSSGEVPSHPFLSAPSCTDIPNILRLCVFLMPPPPPQCSQRWLPIFISLC